MAFWSAAFWCREVQTSSPWACEDSQGMQPLGRTHRIWPFTLLSGVLLDPQLQPTGREALNKLPQQCWFHTLSWLSLPFVPLCNSKSPGEGRRVGVSFHCNLPRGHLLQTLMSPKLMRQTQEGGLWTPRLRQSKGWYRQTAGWDGELQLQHRTRWNQKKKGRLASHTKKREKGGMFDIRTS